MGVITVLTPSIGYVTAAGLTKLAVLTERNVADVVVEIDQIEERTNVDSYPVAATSYALVRSRYPAMTRGGFVTAETITRN